MYKRLDLEHVAYDGVEGGKEGWGGFGRWVLRYGICRYEILRVPA